MPTGIYKRTQIGNANISKARKERKSLSEKAKKEYRREWYIKNKNRILENRKVEYPNNKEKILKRSKEYYNKNKEIVLKRCLEYRKLNRTKNLIYHKEYYKKNRIKILRRQSIWFKEYYLKNKSKVLERGKKQREGNKEYYENYVIKNKERIRKRTKKWMMKNYKRERERINKYERHRRKTDFKYKLDKNLGCAIRTCLKYKGGKNGYKWQSLVGYTIEELIIHLEKQFDEKMSWGNYGNYWHIDHRVPKSWFEYTFSGDESFKKCWALNNLQPLEAKSNRFKHNKFMS